ncbi:hypothetical protein [cf. Phormidesmis sp. LEGE 11477]|uniref:hypothetical protein n=1 Tax=cf. Phormidesmis sp. LEGE 11477 TaxID=1828680 RepID=UPI001881680D|nr:hypothetical protein [cf. Phormidesmis sp. LEGE 11477]MBE9061668.1 hypothetical protein [cf. Phormidesmis sp. LEGE 11477]
MVVGLVAKISELATYLKKSFQKQSFQQKFVQRLGGLKGALRRRCQNVLPLLVCLLVSWSLSSCTSQSRQIRLAELPDIPNGNEVRRLSGPISEVAPPAIFSDLAELQSDQQPQVAIAYPQPDQVIEDTQIEVQLNIQNFSIYKDEEIGLGPHIQLILDNQPARSVYSLEEPITLEALAPGSHTLRAIAVWPWGESFKNETAYAQTTFHLFGKTNENAPDPELPLLTLVEPQGTFGAEPLLLDFYLTNAPLHFLAQENPEDELPEWKVRGTVNGRDFVVDQWQPIYLRGFEPGRNWVQLTLIDEQGQPIENEFNSTIRVIDYDPTQRDALAQLVRGELSLQQVGRIVDLDYQPPLEVTAPEPPEATEPNEIEAKQAETEDEELEVKNLEDLEREDLERETEEIEDTEIEEESPEQKSLEERLETENVETKEPKIKAPNEALDAETVEPEPLDNPLDNRELEPPASEADAGTEEIAPAGIESEQLEFEETEEIEIEEAAPEVEIEGSEAGEAKVDSSKPAEVTPDQSAVEKLDPDAAVSGPTETPKKKSLFEKLFGRKQTPIQASEPVTTPKGVEEPEPPFSEPVAPAITDDDTILSPAQETQIEPEDKVIPEETTNTFDIPTELSAPATPSDNLPTPESVDLEPTESVTVEKSSDGELKENQEITPGESLGN